MDQKIQFIINQAEQLREKYGDPEAIDLSIYTSEESLRKGGVKELTLTEHTAIILQTKEELENRGFTVKLHAITSEQ